MHMWCPGGVELHAHRRAARTGQHRLQDFFFSRNQIMRMREHTCAAVRVCEHTRVGAYACVDLRTRRPTHVWTHACVGTRMRERTRARGWTRARESTHAQTYACVGIRVCGHTFV